MENILNVSKIFGKAKKDNDNFHNNMKYPNWFSTLKLPRRVSKGIDYLSIAYIQEFFEQNLMKHEEQPSIGTKANFKVFLLFLRNSRHAFLPRSSV